MTSFNPIYGPIASRRLGRSLGITTSKEKHCNHQCIYCQLGKTEKLYQNRTETLPLNTIVSALKNALQKTDAFDIITIAGNGEPLLYKPLAKLIDAIRNLTDKPIAIITNGALLYREDVRKDLAKADLVLPTLNGYDEASYQTMHRPHPSLTFQKHLDGLITFSHHYQGALWLEVMLMQGINDSDDALKQIKTFIDQIKPTRVYVNTPLRTPAESTVRACDSVTMERAARVLNGIAIDFLSEGYASTIEDHAEAIKSLIRHHPLHYYEIVAFLSSRHANIPKVLNTLNRDPSIITKKANGFTFYHLKT